MKNHGFARVNSCGTTERQHALFPRRGSALVVVLVVIVMLTLGVYTFTDVMLFERQATSMYEREAQARAFADSGIEWTAAIVGEPSDGTTVTNLYNNPQLFQGILLQDGGVPYGRGRFSVLASLDSESSGQTVRYGLTDESSKLNLNTFLNWDLEESEQRDALMLAFPDMTADIADAILDYIDGDSTAREAGAEDEYYGSLSPPQEAKNGPLQSLDELLRVRGVTEGLLYGEDANRNGLLDPSENDGPATPPLDDADGVLQRGWSPYLTVYSREKNRRLDGTKRINVNSDDLSLLYDDLVEAFGEDVARFVVAYRLAGPQEEEGDQNGDGGDDEGGDDGGGDGNGGQGSGGQGNGGQGGGGQGGGNQGGNNGGGQGGGNNGEGNQGGGDNGGQNGNGGGNTNRQPVIKGGMDVSGGGQQQITSLYDLIGATVQAPLANSQQPEELDSPWPDSASELSGDLPSILDTLTTTDEEFIEGRINIAQAPRAVLYAIPALRDTTVIDQILGAQASGRSSGADLLSATSAWLYTDGIVEIDVMRQLDPFITGRGHVYRMQVLGHYDAGGPSVRLEATIDATQLPPRVLSVRDLTSLGRGFTVAVPE